ncbi:MAG TPA: hypothetical protein VMU01_05940 [Rhizomicrobium sp.]|nr:hypothetical protein [Rhizomicrobium sp.]
MEALFEIGKELGSLTARVSALETKKDCGCGKAKSRGVPLSQMTDTQREVTVHLRKSHKELFKALNEVIAQFGLAEKVRVGTLGLVNVGRPSVSAGTDDCCFCCSNEGVSGWDYCCSDNCEPCCAG